MRCKGVAKTAYKKYMNSKMGTIKYNLQLIWLCFIGLPLLVCSLTETISAPN